MQNIKDEVFLKLVGRRIRELRKGRSLSLLDLSVKMDNHPEQLYRIENGKQNVTISTLKKIADTLGVDICEFFKL